MEDQRGDIGNGVWFGALMFYSLFLSVLGQPDPSVALRVSPNNTFAHQDGTTVTLLCQVFGFNATIHDVSWVRVEPTNVIIATGRDLIAKNDQYLVSFTENVVSIMNFTFLPIEITDSGTYQCNLNRRDGSGFRVDSQEEIVLPVYPKDAFPSCSPNGPAKVNIGSEVSCITSGIATPSINEENDQWTYYSGQNGNGAYLFLNVTSSDNSKTYVCLTEIPASGMHLSCTIGPLIVESVDSASTILPKPSTTVLTPTVVPPGLSAGEIIGIVIGAIVLVIIIAVHTLCCRCDPRRWIHSKDYLINCGRSKETSQETSQAREDTSRSPPDVVMRSEGDDVPPSYSSVLEEHSADVSQPGRLRGESNVYAESPMVTHKPNLNIAVRLNLNIAVAAANVSSEWKQPSDQEPSVRNSHKPQDDTNDHLGTTKQDHTGIGAKSTLTGAPDLPQQTPQIYAQVNKRRGNNTYASGDISQTTTGKPEQAARKPKKFARRDEVPVEVELGSSKTVVYADLDLEKEGQDEIKQLGKPQETLYADIQM